MDIRVCRVPRFEPDLWRAVCRELAGEGQAPRAHAQHPVLGASCSLAENRVSRRAIGPRLPGRLEQRKSIDRRGHAEFPS